MESEIFEFCCTFSTNSLNSTTLQAVWKVENNSNEVLSDAIPSLSAPFSPHLPQHIILAIKLENGNPAKARYQWNQRDQHNSILIEGNLISPTELRMNQSHHRFTSFSIEWSWQCFALMQFIYFMTFLRKGWGKCQRTFIKRSGFN